MNQSTVPPASSSGEPHLVIATIMSDEMNSVVEMHGVVRRSTVSELAAGLGAESGARPVSVVIDLTNSPSFEDSAVLNFFGTSARSSHSGKPFVTLFWMKPF